MVTEGVCGAKPCRVISINQEGRGKVCQVEGTLRSLNLCRLRRVLCASGLASMGECGLQGWTQAFTCVLSQYHPIRHRTKFPKLLILTSCQSSYAEVLHSDFPDLSRPRQVLPSLLLSRMWGSPDLPFPKFLAKKSLVTFPCH